MSSEVKNENFEISQEDNSFVELGRILRCHWKMAVAVTMTVFAGVTAATLLETPEYESEMLILMYREASVRDVPNLEAIEEPNKRRDQDLSTEIRILKSSSLVSKAINSLEISSDELPIVDVILNLSIRQAGDADVLIVSYDDTDPQRAQKVLEALGSTYVEYSLERQRSQATNAIKFIDEQLPQAQRELSQTTSGIRRFQERYGIVEPETYAVEVSQVKQDLQQQEQEMEILLERNKRQSQELRQKLQEAGQKPQAALVNSVLSQDSYYQNLANQLTEIESNLALQLTRFHENHPLVENLKFERNQMQKLLRERTQSILGSATSQIDLNQVVGSGETQQQLTNELLDVEIELATQESQLEAIRQAQAEVAAKFQQIPQLQQVYTELQRQLEVKSKAVNDLLEIKQELRIAEAQEIAPWEILESPYLPYEPDSPNVERNLRLGLLAGGFLGIGTALVSEKLNQKVKRVKDLKQLTGLSLLGTIPNAGKHIAGVSVDRYPANDTQQAFTESVRALAMNLRYLGAAIDRIKILALTSAVPSEGKTTVTYNLGVVLAELGQRVLVVDADLRQPTLHLLAQLPNHVGLTTALTGDSPWYSLVQRGEIQSPDIISSGPIPSNPLALLNSQKMKQLINEWRRTYDYVLIDTPPVSGIADTQSIASYVDGTILLIGMERSTYEEITNSLEILRTNQCTLAGMVANFVDKKHGHSYSYQQSSNHRHSQPEADSRVQGVFGNFWRG